MATRAPTTLRSVRRGSITCTSSSTFDSTGMRLEVDACGDPRAPTKLHKLLVATPTALHPDGLRQRCAPSAVLTSCSLHHAPCLLSCLNGRHEGSHRLDRLLLSWEVSLDRALVGGPSVGHALLFACPALVQSCFDFS